MDRSIRSFAAWAGALALVAGSVGCGGGGGGGGSVSLSGTILGSSVVPRGGVSLQGLQGVVVTVSSATRSKRATTDAGGNFIVLRPPSGAVHLVIDGSGAAGGTFETLELALTVGGGASNLRQPIVLPNLDEGQSESVPVDMSGLTSGDTAVGDPLIHGFSLDIPDGTTILVHGAPPAASVTINVTPVPPINVPMPLPDDLHAGAFVSIQPPGASFSPALGITLPNTEDLPLGTMVDIWSFDHDDGAWVNRSEQTGNRGTVVDIGGTTFIQADQVITEGGWHAGTIPVDPACATTIAGQVFELGSPTPLADVLVSLSTGQFGRTDASGRFRIDSVPAYDPSLLPKVCQAAPVEVRAIAPVASGSGQVTFAVPEGMIVTGGTTNLAPFDIPVTLGGSLVGTVTDEDIGVAGTVTISGTGDAMVESDSDGGFFVASLAEGPYSASFSFQNGIVSRDFTIQRNRTTVVNLESQPQTGSMLQVQVMDFSGLAMPSPVPGACVTLQGASGSPRFAVANGSGVATFDNAPSGPYSVTAQLDVQLTVETTARVAASLIGVTGSGSPPTIVVPLFDDPGIANPIVTDATLEGNVQNIPNGVELEYQVASNDALGFFTAGFAPNGNFSEPVPSGVPLDAAVVARDMGTGEIVSAVFATGLTKTSGQTLMVDFDFANACAFDQTVSVAYSNQQSSTDLSAELRLVGDAVLSFGFGDGMSLPTSMGWPDLASAKLSGFDPFFDVETANFGLTFSESFCTVALGHATPAALNVAFLGTPNILAPANNANFTSYGPGNVVQFSLGSGNNLTAGVNDVTFFGESQTTGMVYFWDILAAPTATSVTLPPVFTNKPMFPDGFYSVDVEALRFDFPGFAFASFFDEDLTSKIAAIVAATNCGADRSHFFTVGNLPLQGGERRDLERRLRLRNPPFVR